MTYPLQYSLHACANDEMVSPLVKPHAKDKPRSFAICSKLAGVDEDLSHGRDLERR